MIFGRGKRRELEEQVKEKSRRLKKLRERLQERDREVEALKARFAEALNGPAARPARDVPVFFLVGQAKSGTSWLMRTFDAHPEILCKGEGRIFGRDYKREDIKEIRSRIQPSSLYAAILDAEYLGAWIERSVWSRDDDKNAHLTGLTRAAIDYFLEARLSKTGKRIVGDKTPFLSDSILEETNNVYPGAKVIHIIRDGRDAAVSAMHHIWNHAEEHGEHLKLEPEERAKRDAYREDPRRVLETGEGLFTEGRIRDLAKSWNAQVGRAVEDGPGLLGEDYTEVRYEDLLARPEEEVGRLLRFLRAGAGEEIVEHCVERASFGRWTKGRERGQEDSTALLRKGVTGDWKNVFTEKDRRIFKEEAGGLLVKLGYEKNYDW